MTSRQRHGAAIAVLLVAAAVVFGEALAKREVFTLRDHTDYFQPMRVFTAAQLAAGHLPLWNPYSASGEPWLANPQTGVFYPPTWLFLLLPFATAYAGYLLFHSLLLGGGTYLLLRRHHSEAAAAAGAAALMLAGPVLSLLDVTNNFATFAWIPLVVWRAEEERARDKPETRNQKPETGDPERDIARPSWRPAALLLAMAFLAGEPFFAAIAAVAYVVIVRRPRRVAAVAVASASLVAVQLLPFVEMLLRSDRIGGFTRADVLRNSMRAGDYLRIFVPPPIASRLAGARAEEFIAVPYAGLLVTLLAIAGIVSLVSRGEWRRAAGWIGVAAGALAIASGPEWIAQLPVTLFRYPSRLVPFASMAIVMLAAAGWDRLRRGSPIVDLILIAVLVTDLAGAARPLLVTAPFRAHPVPYSAKVGSDAKIVRIGDEDFVKRSTREAWVSGYLNLLDRRFDAWTAAPAVSREYAKLYARALRDVNVLRSISAGYVLTGRALPPPFVPAMRSAGVVVNRVEAALPLAYVRSNEVIYAPAKIELGASRLRVIVDLPRYGRLVVTQNDAPGWHLFVDGKPAPKRVALGTFLAADAWPGTHEIVWKYEPDSLRAGAIITLLSLMWIAAGAHIVRTFRRARA